MIDLEGSGELVHLLLDKGKARDVKGEICINCTNKLIGNQINIS